MDRHVTDYLDARLSLTGTPLRFTASTGPIARLRSWQKKRRAIRDLQGLDERLLADIGLTRGDIRPVVEGLLATGQAAANDNRGALAA